MFNFLLNYSNNFTIFELVKEIKAHTFRLTDRDYPFQSVWDSYINSFTMKQGKGEYFDCFQERFNIMVEAAEGYGCVFGSEQVLGETDERWKMLPEDERKLTSEYKRSRMSQKGVENACLPTVSRAH